MRKAALIIGVAALAAMASEALASEITVTVGGIS